MAVGEWGAFAVAGNQTFTGKDAHNFSPARRCPGAHWSSGNAGGVLRFHRGFVKLRSLDCDVDAAEGGGT
ncbi:hypothetical protein BDS110ZK12_70150 [Bradyrhizobium diazoefficiens]|uniref:Uncharacterized protein n=1 Tax=Bradyrhizobium diazoefficiens TaxID=1355477 RepID=A0A809YX74_9BRAD|nr:hypothetical protein XF1B_15940 [Bradyrhizobium diazoefficiens]BCE45166.1 hypothetical protein XF4B_15150 [Bradyrhizobium diazoefficiens]BCE62772.1 hypothetical protein XF6B_15710 [Bradyrhizobium diazoefficiens]BCF06207.1 hypothetical protein XF12B_15800 [Bradyrhizobium diazoefficiens]BCF23640.1 hypothetical protein XF14B_15920 [Bradyrhizobium diazoefficiens]